MFIYKDLRVELNEDLDDIKKKISNKLKINSSDIKNIDYYKKSIDARNKKDIFFMCSIIFDVAKKINNKKVIYISYEKAYPVIKKESNKFSERPIIVGFGPSGMFSALFLARKGYKPLVIEMGKKVEDRTKDIEEFFKTGKLNKNCNVCFGEGGAGTFSDGKLNSGNNDQNARLILNEFVKHGANKEILYEGKPHIGTDILVDVVKNIREEIINLGGEFMFETKFTDFNILNNNKIEICTENNGRILNFYTNNLFLGIGHSSIDTFKLLKQKGCAMSKKNFAIGLRINHSQEYINKLQYGDFYNNIVLGPAPYKIVEHLSNNRTIFSFCNCPGGYVVNSSSEGDNVVCNGMSYNARDGKYANSALLINVNTTDIDSEDPMDGFKFQNDIEHKMFKVFNKNVLTVQKTIDYINNKETKEFNDIDMICKYKLGKLNGILPSFVEESLILGLNKLEEKYKGFVSHSSSCLIGVETRSSCPVRLDRTKSYTSNSFDNIYVIGEGAGYAGGIMTSAIDGLNAAMALYEKDKRE